jgi:hypothetical protein
VLQLLNHWIQPCVLHDIGQLKGDGCSFFVYDLCISACCWKLGVVRNEYDLMSVIWRPPCTYGSGCED